MNENKSGEKSGGELVPQPHGGAIRNGSAPGNTPGPGRPKGVVRDQLAGVLEDRVPVVAAIADGEAVRKTRVPLSSLLRHARCPECDGKFEAKEGVAVPMVEIEGLISATPGERIKALDMAARFGLGPMKNHDESLVRDLGLAVAEVFAGDERIKVLHDRWVRVIGEHLEKRR